MSRRRGILLAAWVLGGWLAALVVAPRLRFWLEERNQRTTGPAFGLANDVAMSLAAALDEPKHMAELAGVALAEPQANSSCELTWTDREKTLVYAVRPARAIPETAWRAVTVPGKAVLGRYSADLWAGDCRTPGADYESPCTKVEQVRLLERQEVAVPAPAATGGATPLLPGQCALGAFGGKPGVVGRYKVKLPAEREFTVRAFVLPATAFLSYRLTLQGKEAPHVDGENTVSRSVGEGEYDLEVTLLSVEGAREVPGEYGLQVHWGKAVGPRCPIPGFDERDCYGKGSRDGGQP